MPPRRFDPDTDLAIERRIQASPETIWRCWSEPVLFKQWFTPEGVDVVEVENELVPGGRAFNVMRLPDGNLVENDGCFVLAEPHSRLVFTDSLRAGYRPAPGAGFLSVDLTLEPGDGGTLYAAHVMHADAAQRQAHLDMGFMDGWGTTIAQLDVLAQRIEGQKEP